MIYKVCSYTFLQSARPVRHPSYSLHTLDIVEDNIKEGASERSLHFVLNTRIYVSSVSRVLVSCHLDVTSTDWSIFKIVSRMQSLILQLNSSRSIVLGCCVKVIGTWARAWWFSNDLQTLGVYYTLQKKMGEREWRICCIYLWDVYNMNSNLWMRVPLSPRTVMSMCGNAWLLDYIGGENLGF